MQVKAHQLRTIELEGAPWFCGADLLRILGLTVATGSHYGKLASDERTKVNRITLGAQPGKAMMVVNESGLYKLIMRSDKAEAVVFQNWVTREVLPAIRRTGGFLLNEDARQTAHADERQTMPLPVEMLQVGVY